MYYPTYYIKSPNLIYVFDALAIYKPLKGSESSKFYTYIYIIYTKNSKTITLNVQGKNYRGVWSDINDSIKIKILAPWWMTWWFKILNLLAIFGTIYGVFKYRNRQKEKIQKLRNRISKDLHDEIGSTISSIALYRTVAEKKIDPSQKEVHSVLSRINESSTSAFSILSKENEGTKIQISFKLT